MGNFVKKVNDNGIEDEKLISKDQLREIRDDIKSRRPQLVISALTDEKARKELARFVRRNYKPYIRGRQKVTEYIVKELVGMGFLEDILVTDDITDIGWNGTFLTVETNQAKVSMTPEELGGITKEDINVLVSRFSAVKGDAVNDSHPLLNLLKDNLRVSATDDSISPDGKTLSIRVTRPSLALNQNNFKVFAPMFILDFIHKIMLTRCNITIAGITGTGKTELQKLMISFCNPTDRIIMVEDVRETHIKELFPDKDIYSWVTNEVESIKDLVKQSLRNNPDWVVVSETRGSEAYEMLQSILTGNNIVTTLHAASAKAIPKRFANMIATDYGNTTEDSLMDDILTYFDFGFHIQKLMLKDETTGEELRVRYLDEIREYDNEDPKGGRVIFKQEFLNGDFYITTGQLTEGFQKRMRSKFLDPTIPEYHDKIRTDLEDTNVGKMLKKIKSKLNENKTKKINSTLYNGYVDMEDSKTDSMPDTEVLEDPDSDSSNLVKPPFEESTKKHDYTNPDHLSASESSLFKGGLDQREGFKKSLKPTKMSPTEELRSRTIHKSQSKKKNADLDMFDVGSNLGSRVIKK